MATQTTRSSSSAAGLAAVGRACAWAQGFRVRPGAGAEFGVIGYGIQLGPNVFPMFDRLGVTDAVLAQSIVPRRAS